MNAQEEELLSHVPEDGHAIGNRALRAVLSWDEDAYWATRNPLIEAGVLEKGRGKGGSVKRVVEPEDVAAARSEPAEVTEAAGVLYADEAALYEPMRDVIASGWAKERGVTPDLVSITASKGSMKTGRWARPDIVSVAVRTFMHLPGRFIEVITFEIKPTHSIDVLAVYEALGHRRSATHAYVLLHIPPDQEQATQVRVEDICEVARSHGIGVIIANDPADHETWEERESALRVEPDPAKLDNFIATQLREDAPAIARAVR